MRKHFLILMLMVLLPLAGWAQIDLSGVTPTLSQNSYIYTGATPEVVIHVVSPTTQQEIDDVEWIKVFYDANGNEIASSSVATDVLNVGTYYVAAQVPEGNPTFRGTTKKVEFNITARPLTISFAQVDKTYGYHRDANYTSDAKFITYTVTDANYNTPKVYDPFSATAATATEGKAFVQAIGLTVQREAQDENYNVAYNNDNVVGYAFSWEVADDNYVVTRATSGTPAVEEATNFKINPKELAVEDIANITYTAGTHVYNGNKQVGTFVNAEGYDYDYDVTWHVNANLSDEPVASPKEVGTYYAKLTGKGNYSGSLGYTAAPDPDNNSKTWKFTITRRPVTIEIVDGTKVYDGQNIDLTTVSINYGNIAPADAQSIINNFGNTISVDFGDDAQDHKAVKYTDGQNPTVTHYDLVLKVTDGFADTKLFKNYGFEQPNDEVTAISVDGNKVIEGISGKYTITRRPVQFKANLVTTTFGTEPIVPEVSIGDASKEADVTGANAKSVLYVAPAEGTENEGIVVYNTTPVTSDLTGFVVADFQLSKTAKAKKGSNQYAWNVAPADLYEGAIVLAKGATAAQYSDMSKNYDITYTPGDVRVGGLTVRVTVNTTSIKYGDEVSNDLFSYSTNPSNKTLGGTPNYHIYEIAIDANEEYIKGDEVTDEEILPTGTYWVELDKNGMTAPANYELGEFNPGYLIVEKKPITIAINALTVGAGTTKAKLNTYASVDEAYKDNLVGADKTTGLAFTYSYNTGNEANVLVPTGYVWQAAESGDQGFTAEGDLKSTANGTFTKGITAALIQKEVVNNEVVDNGWIAANESYEVTFTPGKLTILAGAVFQLAEDDANLLDKIKVAAAAATPNNITFGSRELKREVWTAMVLPFETTVKEVSAALDYAVVDVLDVTENSNDMHLKLHMGKINANQPFIVKYYKEDEPAVYYTQEEVNAYNATLNGHRSTTDIKTPGNDAVYFTKGDIYDAKTAWDALDEEAYLTDDILPVLIAAHTSIYNYTTNTRKSQVENEDVTAFNAYALQGEDGSDDPSTLVKVAATHVYYTQEECDAYNATLTGARKTTDVKTAAVDHSTLDLNTLPLIPGKKIVYDADADYVNEDGNVFVQNANNGHQFIGVYNPVDVAGAEYKWIRSKDGALVDGAKYKEQGTTAHMRRLIAYFKLNTTNGNARILIDEPDGTTTVINAVTAETMNVQADGWYTLNGVKLQSIPTQKGIYINNGKKVVIK